jgi:hypothetical protein
VLSEHKKTKAFGKIPKDELAITAERWEEELNHAITLKVNAERTLEWMRKKFTYLFEEKKMMIREIKHNSERIKQLEELLKQYDTYIEN